MRKTTPGRELRALNGKKRLWVIKEKKTIMGRVLKALNVKEKTVGHK